MNWRHKLAGNREPVSRVESSRLRRLQWVGNRGENGGKKGNEREQLWAFICIGIFADDRHERLRPFFISGQFSSIPTFLLYKEIITPRSRIFGSKS
jgi:hypothetical protein